MRRGTTRHYLRPAQHDRASAGGDEGGLRSGDLIRRGAANLANTFEEVVYPMDVALAEQSAVGIHWE